MRVCIDENIDGAACVAHVSRAVVRSPRSEAEYDLADFEKRKRFEPRYRLIASRRRDGKAFAQKRLRAPAVIDV